MAYTTSVASNFTITGENESPKSCAHEKLRVAVRSTAHVTTKYNAILSKFQEDKRT